MERYLRSGLMAVALAVAASFFVFGFYVADTEESPLPAEIEDIVPSEDAIIRPQDEVGADLEDTFTGVLVVGNDEIPLDQLATVDPLGQVYFRPGPDKVIERFEPGTHSVTVLYWPKERTRDEADSFTWRFRVG